MLETIQKHIWQNFALRYSISILVVLIAFWSYWLMTAWFGPGLPTYILFYPAVIIVALLAGFGPGILATLLAVIIAGVWILLPIGQFTIEEPINMVGAVLFGIMGILISSAVELFRRKVAERTARIEETYNKLKNNESKLKETVKELKRSNDELRQFTYITSHDLQEPLRSIASYAQLIERRYKGQLDPDADEFIDFMVSGTIILKQQIQGLLNYSRIDKQDNFEPSNMEEVLNLAIFNLNALIKENSAVITHDKLPVVTADKKQIIQVFQNLIGNAIKFKKETELPKIHISAYLDENNQEYVFSISDNGIGIEEQYTDRIFEVFKRLHTIDEYQGTGIGLAIVKRIIEHHGGHIWVESELGEGSTFYFTIPIEHTT